MKPTLLLVLSVLLLRADEVTLAWNPSPEPEVTGYRLRYGFASGQWLFQKDMGLSTTGTVAALVPGSNYYFVVTAYNAFALESLESNEVVYRALAPPVKPPVVPVRPDPPNSLRVIRLSGEQAMEDTVNIAWSPAARTLPDTSYVLYATTNVLSATTLSNAPIRLVVGTNLMAGLREVTAGRWAFAITAARGGLESFPANVLVVEVSPAPPEGGTVINAGAFRVRLP